MLRRVRAPIRDGRAGTVQRMSDAYGQVEVTSQGAWREWLAANHGTSPGVWLVTYKKAEGDRYVPYDATVEEALCFGWIDSKSRALDERRSMLLMTPRKRGSGWSRPNKERLERLFAAGLMAPAGVAVVEAAKADGSWTALDEIENLVEPPDLSAALDAMPAARASWDGFPRSAKRALLEWISLAKRAETRAKRIEETATRAARGERANQWPR
jgi:uncharacterized protein YdeI (YjbR/CyaY-like superfamily)